MKAPQRRGHTWQAHAGAAGGASWRSHGARHVPGDALGRLGEGVGEALQGQHSGGTASSNEAQLTNAARRRRLHSTTHARLPGWEVCGHPPL